jgi:nucleotide-binding universal stress UspA family protein
MYKHILIPTDGSEVAQKGVAAGIDYAREARAKVTLFTAVPAYEPPGEGHILSYAHVISLEEHERQSAITAKNILERAMQAARDAGVDVQTDYALNDHPWEAIVEAARKHGCDAIVMGSHGRKALSRLFHGSQAIDVLAHTDLPTLVVR